MTKANETHISLETAMLLKGCGVESKMYYVDLGVTPFEPDEPYIEVWSIEPSEDLTDDDIKSSYPAYTWQEVLLEAKTFFGSEWIKHRDWYNGGEYRAYIIISEKLLRLLQQKKYEEADLYFRKNTILTK